RGGLAARAGAASPRSGRAEPQAPERHGAELEVDGDGEDVDRRLAREAQLGAPEAEGLELDLVGGAVDLQATSPDQGVPGGQRVDAALRLALLVDAGALGGRQVTEPQVRRLAALLERRGSGAVDVEAPP